MLIDVTEEHIKDGIREDECNCPIALAVCDAVLADMPEGYKHPNVITVVHDEDIQVYYLNGREIEYQFNISPKVKGDWDYIGEFISEFDGNHYVEPFEMEFEVVQ